MIARLSARPFVRPLAAAALLALLVGCAGPSPDDRAAIAAAVDGPADLVVRGGTILTVDDDWSEVEALAVRDGRIVARGTADAIAALIDPSTEIVELDGRVAMPGFIEGHGHFLGLGERRAILDLRAEVLPTWDAIVARVRAAAAEVPAGTWIRGRGWHQDKWADPPSPAVEGFPIHDALSAAVPDHPVLLTHASGHAAIANAAALRAANVDVDAVAAAARTPDPPGGEIVRRDDGRPTGLLRELAAGLVDAARQRDEGPTDRETLRRYVALATDEVQRNGITSFHDAGTGFGAIELLKEAARDGTLGVRLWIMARADHDTLAASLPVAKVRDLADGMLTVGGIKLQIDGALGARGAWLLEPYTDAPGHFGLALMTVEEAERVAELAVENDVQLAIHAIGDRANREVLDLYERVQQRHPGVRDKRWRVEHAQHLHPDDVPRFAALGAVASMQGVHCTSDGPWVPNRLGLVRSEQGAYLWRTLVESGALLINGTDAPVEDVDPLASYISTVTRRMANGRAFFPAQALDRHTALASYTRNAAEAVFELADKGTLEVGKRADIVVLSGDPLTVDDDALDDLRVEMTILNGQTVYRAESSHAAPAAG